MKRGKKKYILVLVSIICVFVLIISIQLYLNSEIIDLKIYGDSAKVMLENELKIDLTDNIVLKNISLLKKSFSNTDTLYVLFYVQESEINTLVLEIEQSSFELINNISQLENRTNKSNYLGLDWWFNSFEEIDKIYISSGWPLTSIYLSKAQDDGILRIYVEKETTRAILQNEYGIEVNNY